MKTDQHSSQYKVSEWKVTETERECVCSGKPQTRFLIKDYHYTEEEESV